MTTMSIGEKIKTERLKKGWKQEDLAKQLSVSRSTISSWEVNRNSPDLDTIVLLSDLFSISLDTLLRGNHNMLDTSEVTTFQLKKVSTYFQITDNLNNIQYHMEAINALPTQKKYHIKDKFDSEIGIIKRKRYSLGMYDLPRLYLTMQSFNEISVIKDMEQFRTMYKIKGEDIKINGTFLSNSFSISKKKEKLADVMIKKVNNNFLFTFTLLDQKYEKLVSSFLFLLALVYEEEKNKLHF